MKIAIIGAGPTGIAAGHELLKQGFTDFTLYEASDGIGGTRYLHSYPGLACNIWAHAYTYTDAPNPDWSAKFVPQPEIQRYLADCACPSGILDRIDLLDYFIPPRKDGSHANSSPPRHIYTSTIAISASGSNSAA